MPLAHNGRGDGLAHELAAAEARHSKLAQAAAAALETFRATTKRKAAAVARDYAATNHALARKPK